MERKETELGYSALLDCWKSLMCLLQDSGLLLYPWADHLLNQTGPATHKETHQARIRQTWSCSLTPSGALPPLALHKQKPKSSAHIMLSNKRWLQSEAAAKLPHPAACSEPRRALAG